MDLLSLHFLVLLQNKPNFDLREVTKLSRIHVWILNDLLELQMLSYFLLLLRLLLIARLSIHS